MFLYAASLYMSLAFKDIFLFSALLYESASVNSLNDKKRCLYVSCIRWTGNFSTYPLAYSFLSLSYTFEVDVTLVPYTYCDFFLPLVAVGS